MKFTLDFSTWIAGGHGDHRIGKGNTCLLNGYGYMCCLGHVALQACEFNKGLMFNIGTPAKIPGVSVPWLTTSTFNNSLLSINAIAINDNEDINTTTRMNMLSGLFCMYGHELHFINVPDNLLTE